MHHHTLNLPRAKHTLSTCCIVDWLIFKSTLPSPGWCTRWWGSWLFSHKAGALPTSYPSSSPLPPCKCTGWWESYLKYRYQHLPWDCSSTSTCTNCWLTSFIFRLMHQTMRQLAASSQIPVFTIGMFPCTIMHIHTHTLLTHLLHLQVNAPDDQVVGGFLTNQIGVFLQVLKAVVIALHHAILPDLSFVLFAKLLLKQWKRNHQDERQNVWFLIFDLKKISHPSLSNLLTDKGTPMDHMFSSPTFPTSA